MPAKVYKLFGAVTIGYLLLAICVSGAQASPVYPGDPDALSKQWHLQKIEAYEAWSKSMGSQNITVAVIDTGVDLDHPDLVGNIWKNPREVADGLDNDNNGYVDDINGWDFVSGDKDPNPNIDETVVTIPAIHHGTIVAGLIGATANNGIGGVGVASKVKIMPLRALDSRGRGDVGTVIEALRYAVANGAQIINLSFVGPGFDRDLFTALQDAWSKGVLVVAAVGNKEDSNGQDLDTLPLYPVCYSGSNGEDVVLGVAAVDEQDKKSGFSNYGASCVDISAPGSAMYGSIYYNPARGFNNMFGGNFSGSSMAAPLVSGVAALIKAFNPAYSPQDIRNIIIQSAEVIDAFNPAYVGKLGRGRLNARHALELAVTGGNAVLGPNRGVPYLAVAPQGGAAPEVNVFSSSGASVRSFLAYAQTFRGGAHLAFGDTNKDGIEEVITGAGVGGGPFVRVFSPTGTVYAGWFAFDKYLRGGVNVAVGDINGDGVAEIVTTSGPGGAPQVRIFDTKGKALGVFFAYDKYLRGGANVTLADIDQDGKAEIIVAPGKGVGYKGEIKIFSDRGQLKKVFAAYPTRFANGVRVGAGDLDGDGTIEIVTTPSENNISEVRVYSATGAWQRAFLAFEDSFKGGADLAVGDVDRDGQAEIVVGAGKGHKPDVVVFNGFGRTKQQFLPYDAAFRGGVNVGIIKL